MSNFLARLPIIRSILAQPFVTATGTAAFIHSCWTLSTMFNGIEPAQFSWQWLAWVVPGALIAFAIDLGQIVTSAELRSGERTKAKYGTFATFAVFTYLLQFVYMIQHVPTLDVSMGVRAEWQPLATLIRDACIFLIPALLPIGTVMYTFSYGKPKKLPNANKPPIGDKPLPTVARNESMSLVAVARSNGTELTVGVTNQPNQVDRALTLYVQHPELRDRPSRWLEDNVQDQWGKIGRNAWTAANKAEMQS